MWVVEWCVFVGWFECGWWCVVVVMLYEYLFVVEFGGCFCFV